MDLVANGASIIAEACASVPILVTNGNSVAKLLTGGSGNAGKRGVGTD
jgi:hypothetical protein